MWYYLFLISITVASQTISIFNFSSKTPLDKWQIVNDGVMGGLSKSSLGLTNDGYGLFSGHVSTKNNGGFASLRLPVNIKIHDEYQYIVLKVKGDGKTYQCRLKGSENQAESYVNEFKTTGEWQIIQLKLKDFAPKFRGRSLNKPNFDFDKIEQFGILIASKKEADFNLLMDVIEIK
jgi:hypothetical protein